MSTENIAQAIRDTLISPNEVDRNLEAANIVDALFAVARGLFAIAEAIKEHGKADLNIDYRALNDLPRNRREAAER